MIMKGINTEGNLNINIGNNPEAERIVFEKDKYGRAPHPELAAHPHVYLKHSIEPAYGFYDRPINEIV